MRLIDADKLTDGKGVFSDVIHVDFEKGGGYIMVEDLLNILDSQPTAYDMDKVVKRLESMQDITGWDLLTVQECLRIVKSGGIE